MSRPSSPPVIDYGLVRRRLKEARDRIETLIGNARIGLDVTHQRAHVAQLLREAADELEPPEERL